MTDVGCTFLNEGQIINETENHCFCYKPQWSLDVMWSALQIHVQSTERVLVIPRHNCTHPGDTHAYVICWLRGVWEPQGFEDVLLDVNQLDKDFCFHLNVSSTTTGYRVTLRKSRFTLPIFIVLISILLFCLAGKLSRSSVCFYAAGIMLGMITSVLFVLIVLKRFISKPSTIWLLINMCCFLTAYVVQFLNENLAWVWTEKKPYIIGHCILFGLLGFAACYSYGPLCSEISFKILTWTLQIIACILIYFFHPVNEIAVAVIAILLSSKGLSCLYRAISYIYRKWRQKKPSIRFLTEEEYIEQCEVETLKALKELRDFCSSPDFNSWITVCRLSSPKRFAEFVLGSSHISSEEFTTHEHQYGLGSLFLEELIVHRKEVEDDENVNAEDFEIERTFGIRKGFNYSSSYLHRGGEWWQSSWRFRFGKREWGWSRGCILKE
ncbi:nuclear envelope integral membrane protein 2 isoform X2 [Bufo gargarizans]|uniref:nuclear envelope integral membrane protein 2 isoform X2 n=1 Tax=Bufo gargarizans TaxID=30331 RepID=UPI001CF4AD91|nr:nuclear envelope integral membrane protein 2 isoform X2 [Bufo gargarizans]